MPAIWGTAMFRLVSASLIALAGFVAPVQAGTIAFSETDSGTLVEPLTFVFPNLVGTAALSGSGTGTFGSFTFTANSDLTIFGPPPSFTSVSITNGTVTVTYSDGTLFGTSSGTGTTNGTTATDTINVIYTGGTGVFAGDTGTATELETVDIDANTFTSTVTGTLTTTPLPTTWLMLLSGFVGLGLFAYRGSKKSAGAFAAA